MRIIIGVDSQFVYHNLRSANLNVKFPYREFQKLVEGEGDEVLDMFSTVVRFPPSSDTDFDLAKAHDDFTRVSLALQHQGVHVIEAPAKITPSGGVKHSDDKRLMIRLALACTRLRPDFLVLVAGDGDYAPLVWGLREEGIRTKLITNVGKVATDLKVAVYSVSDMFNVLEQLETASGSAGFSSPAPST